MNTSITPSSSAVELSAVLANPKYNPGPKDSTVPAIKVGALHKVQDATAKAELLAKHLLAATGEDFDYAINEEGKFFPLDQTFFEEKIGAFEMETRDREIWFKRTTFIFDHTFQLWLHTIPHWEGNDHAHSFRVEGSVLVCDYSEREYFKNKIKVADIETILYKRRGVLMDGAVCADGEPIPVSQEEWKARWGAGK